MKISVVADSSGKILGFSHASPGRASSHRVVTALDEGDGHTVHEVELTPELAQRAHDDDFADAIFAHIVVKKGKTATLARGESPTHAKPRKR
jgi:hypothetical protein